MRGSDIECCPVFMAYVLITSNEVSLYVDKKKLTKETEIELNDLGVIIQPYESVFDFLSELSNVLKESDKKLFIPKNCSYAALQAVKQVSSSK